MNIGAWLDSLGLGQYEPAFRENAIDSGVLANLTADDLKEIGVGPVGHRRRLLDAIAALAGAGLPPPTPARDGAERRPITVMFCDLVDSTRLAADLDAEDWRDLLREYLDEASKAVNQYGGHVLKKLGDGLMALFGYPKAQENDAERAARAGLAVLRAIDALNERNIARGLPPLAARLGLDSGPVIVDPAGEVYGDAPNVAARVEGFAEPGTLLVTEAVHRQVAGLFVAESKGAPTLKGVSNRTPLYRILRTSGGGRRTGGRSQTTLVGREEELTMLARRFERARGGEGQFVRIVGEPGIGKTRLVEEFRTRLAATPHTWLEWAASQLLQNAPLHPIAEWGRQRFADPAPLAQLQAALAEAGLGDDTALIAPLIDIPVAADGVPAVASAALRGRQLDVLVDWTLASARAQPQVLWFEDLHWADPTTLELMALLAERGARAPLMIVATTRPEFQAPWPVRAHHATISLVPLDRTQIRRMVASIAERHALSSHVVEGVGDRSGGVPLFVEEVTRLMLEGGATTIPPTLQQSLAARLDRLGDAREVAQVGAVLGRAFPRALIAAVSDLSDAALDAALDQLAQADLLFLEGPTSTYRFKHALIQDAAYDSLLKSQRQILHRRAAEALVASTEPRPELVAHHFTQGGLTELAVEWWDRAGDAALRRSAFQEAVAQFGKAIELSDRESRGPPRRDGAAPLAVSTKDAASRRVAVRAKYAHALLITEGHAASATRQAVEAVDEAPDVDEPQQAVALFSQWSQLSLSGRLQAALDATTRALRVAEADGLAMLAAAAHRLLSLTHFMMGSLHLARAHAETAVALYDERWAEAHRAATGLDFLACAYAYHALALLALGELEASRRRMAEAIHRVDALRQPWSAAVVRAHDLVRLGLAERPRDALPVAEALGEIVTKHSIGAWAPHARLYRLWAAGRLDNPDAAAKALRDALPQIRAADAHALELIVLHMLADLSVAANASGEATRYAEEGLRTGASHAAGLSLSPLHRLRGDSLVNHDPAAAESAYRESMDIARAQGARTFELQAALPLARLLRASHRSGDARQLLAAALEGFSPSPELPAIALGQALLAALDG